MKYQIEGKMNQPEPIPNILNDISDFNELSEKLIEHYYFTYAQPLYLDEYPIKLILSDFNGDETSEHIIRLKFDVQHRSWFH